MRTWTRPLILALWVALLTIILLAVLGITAVPVANTGFLLGGLFFTSFFALIGAFVLLRGIEPKLRTLRNDLALTILLALALLIFTFFLTFVLPLPAGILSLAEFIALVFLLLALLASLANIALYFIFTERRRDCCD